MKNDDSFDLMDHRYLRLRSVLELIPVGRSTWYKWVQCGIAPQPTKLSLRIAAWKVEDIKNLLEEIGKPDWQEKIKRNLESA